MMLASEIEYVLEQLKIQEGMDEIPGDVYTLDNNGNKVPLDFLYIDEDGDLIFTTDEEEA